MSKEKITSEQFVEIWQTSKTVAEVVERTGLTLQRVYSKSWYFRRQKVPLKKHPYAPKNDWDSLADLARSFAKNESKYTK